ncbi:MAG: hypothetical protein M1822_002998 [Bathelium mastoideum]|nr:MAG: hypothetical protein M1822_002998 [Bathelium mastoideum]
MKAGEPLAGNAIRNQVLIALQREPLPEPSIIQSQMTVMDSVKEIPTPFTPSCSKTLNRDADDPLPSQEYLYLENSPEKCLQVSSVDAKKVMDSTYSDIQDAVVKFMRYANGETLTGDRGCQIQGNPGPLLARLYQRVMGASWHQRYLQLASKLNNWPLLEGLIGAAILETIFIPKKTYPEIALNLADWKTVVTEIRKRSSMSKSA